MSQRICLESPYCGLCRFDLEYNNANAIVMITKDGVVSPPLARDPGEEEAVVGDQYFHPCGGSEWPKCGFGQEDAMGYHESCLEFDRRLAVGPISAGFLGATEFAFEPPVSVRKRRRAFVLAELADTLACTYPLPPEICHDVAKYLTREYAIVHLRLLSSKASGAHSYSVGTTRDIYATFVTMDGIRRVESLSNAKDSGKAELVWTAPASSEPKDIYVAEDYWGLRSFLAAPEATQVTEEAGVWWRRLSPSSRGLRVHTDVSPALPRRIGGADWWTESGGANNLLKGWKARRVVDPESDGPIGPAWSSPPLPELEKLELRDLGFPPGPSRPSTMRVTALRINDADVIGYSACLDGSSILALRAHYGDRRGERSSFYEDVDRRGAVWLYMPVARDERIIEIRMRENVYTRLMDRNDDHGLMLVSDKGRTVMFGQHHSSKYGPVRAWRLLSRFTTKGPSSLVFGPAFGRVTTVACSDGLLSPTSKCPYPSSQVPHSHPAPWMRYSWGYYTSAPLDGVVRVIPCQTGSGDTSAIIGLLLEYADNSLACVGQYRHDGVSWALDVGDSPGLSIGFGWRRHSFHHIAQVAVDGPRHDVGLTWLELPWHGPLDWWVGPRELVICHGEQKSPYKYRSEGV